MTTAQVGRAAAWGVLAALLAGGLPSSVFGQCAMCKAALESSPDGLGAQFNRAILVMMAGPYLLMGVFGVVLCRDRLRDAGRRTLARLSRLRSR
jgi:hypothetical protein